jgi:hypothetical protein
MQQLEKKNVRKSFAQLLVRNFRNRLDTRGAHTSPFV